jgi:predicted DNA-binding WGR domain protein
MPRYELVEGTSSKFWEIALSGKSFTTTYGRIGGAGQSTTKKFASEADAAREHDKLIGEKLRKGYSAAGVGRGAAKAVGKGTDGTWRAAYQALPGARAARAKAVTTALALADAAFDLPCAMQVSWKATGEGLLEALEERFVDDFELDHTRAGRDVIVSCKNGAGVRTSLIPAAKLEDHGAIVGTVAVLVDMVALGLVPLNDGDDGHVVFVPAKTKQALAKILGASFAAAFEEQTGMPARAGAAPSAREAPRAGAPPRNGRVERQLKDARKFTDQRLQQEIRSNQSDIVRARATRDREEILHAMHSMEMPLRWRGTRDLAMGKPAGWNDLLDASWITITFYDRFRVRGIAPAEYLAPALLLVLGLGGWSKKLARVVAGMSAVAAAARGSDRNEAHVVYFASFCAELFAKGRAKPRGPKGALLRLAEHALDKTLPSKLLADACAFQLKNGGLTDDDGTQLSSHALIPVWWFALAKARAARGLPTPRPHHALFATPLATLPDPSTYDPAANPLIAEMAKL